MINPSHQLLIMARLSEFCQYRVPVKSGEIDGWGLMLHKLKELEEPLAALKTSLLQATGKGMLQEMRAGALDDERYADFKTLFERLLAPGDFADLAIHLRAGAPDRAHQLSIVTQTLKPLRAHHLFIEEGKPPEERSPAWEKLIAGLHQRLDLERLSAVMKRKPRPGRRAARPSRRKAAVLRRLRRNVAEYCSVLRIPTSPSDTFTPFMLPRLEALIAANLRFLKKFR